MSAQIGPTLWIRQNKTKLGLRKALKLFYWNINCRFFINFCPLKTVAKYLIDYEKDAKTVGTPKFRSFTFSDCKKIHQSRVFNPNLWKKTSHIISYEGIELIFSCSCSMTCFVHKFGLNLLLEIFLQVFYSSMALCICINQLALIYA